MTGPVISSFKSTLAIMSLAGAALISVAGAIEYKSDEWYQAKDAAWRQVGQLWPEAMNDGPFRKRMFELDEWAKEYDRDLFEDPEKPMRYAWMVVVEQRLAGERAAAENVATESDPMVQDLNVFRDSTRNEIQAAQQTDRDHLLFALVLNPLAAVVGFWTSGSGLTRRGIWIWFIGIVGVAALISSDSGLSGLLPILAGVYSGALGSRALNAGYPIWLAAIAGVPLLSLPLVAHLMFFNGRRKAAE